MTARSVTTLRCDVADCDQSFEIGLADAGPTRSCASKSGWSHTRKPVPGQLGRPSRDFCPKHAAEATP
jgi:hypothetical protein